jgi:hypothetical protein
MLPPAVGVWCYCAPEIQRPTLILNSGLVWLEIWSYVAHMSTVIEIEAAIARLPADEQASLRDRLLARAATKPKTGAELAALWPNSFHLTPQEADDFERDLEAAHQNPPKALAWE